MIKLMGVRNQMQNGLKAIKGHGFVDAKRRTRKADHFQIN